MKITLRVDVICSSANLYWGPVEFELKTEFAPSLEIAYSLPPLMDSRNPVSITYIVEEDRFDVCLGKEEYATKEECRTRSAEFHMYGWKIREHMVQEFVVPGAARQ